MMQAIVLDGFGGPEVMRLAQVEKPEPGPGQVLIRVHATSVNRPDIVQRQGNYHPPKGESDVLGLEVSGTIAALGPDVNGWQQGDRVMALIGGGGYAEFAVAYADHLIPVPDGLSMEQAACVCETYLTAFLNLFRLAALEDGESVLLHGGGGGVNTAAIHLCQHLAPKSPILVTASTGKIEGVRSLGVEHVIDYRQTQFEDEVKAITSGKGVDVILDHIGADYLPRNMKSLAVYGRLVIIGVTSGVKGELNLALMMVKRQQILGSVLRPRSVAEKKDIITDFRQRTADLFAGGKMVPLVSDVFPLAEAADAHRRMESSTHFGKIVLTL